MITETKQQVEQLMKEVDAYNDYAGEDNAICWHDDIASNFDLTDENAVNAARMEIANRMHEMK